MHFVLNFVSKLKREQMFEDFFSVSYHGFCVKVAPEAIAIFLLVCFINDFVRK